MGLGAALPLASGGPRWRGRVSWRSNKRLAGGAYYCTCPKLVPGHVHDGKDFTDGTIEDEADALFGIESRFYID